MARIPLWRRYARLFGSDTAADVNDELQFHLEAKVDELIERGWQPDAARREIGSSTRNARYSSV